MRTLALASVGLTLVLLISCADDDHPKRGQIVFSPNGQPLTGGPLGKASCEDALAAWADKMATGPNDIIELPRFIADARRQFAAMDLDHDGFLTAAELAKYRAPFDFNPLTRRDQEANEQTKLSPRNDHEYNESQPDPVMVADVKMRFKVSLDDFLTYERRNFIRMDTEKTGHLAKKDIVRTCDDT